MKRFEVRNSIGQYIGVWYAKTAKLATARAEAELNAGRNAFRKSWGRISLSDCTAVEMNGGSK